LHVDFVFLSCCGRLDVQLIAFCGECSMAEGQNAPQGKSPLITDALP